MIASLEYFLYELSRECEVNDKLQPVELWHNPFLTHWVEVVQTFGDRTNERMRMVRKSPINAHRGKLRNARLAVVEIILRDEPSELEVSSVVGRSSQQRINICITGVGS